MDTVRGPSLFRVSLILLIVFVLASWCYRAFSEPTSQTPSKVRVEQEPGVLLGDGDVRFGVVVEPGGGALVANWQNYKAVHIDDQGRASELGIRVRHPHTGISIPPDGFVLIEDLQGDYYALTADGHLTPVPGIR